jgi:hypothetical protein
MGTKKAKKAAKTPALVRAARLGMIGVIVAALIPAVATRLSPDANTGDKPIAIPNSPPNLSTAPTGPPVSQSSSPTPPSKSSRPPRLPTMQPGPSTSPSRSSAEPTSSASSPAPPPAVAAPLPVSPPTASTEIRQPYEVAASDFQAGGDLVWTANGPTRLNGGVQGPQVSCSEEMLFQAKDFLGHLITSVRRTCDHEKWPDYTPVYLPSSSVIARVDIVLIINGRSAARVICWRYADCKPAGTP